MNTDSQNNPLAEISRDELLSALFSNMVFQSTNAALMFLGRVPHPETKETVVDLDAARMFMDQLEMLAVKTSGNLTREEDKLLQQSLKHLRLVFGQTIENRATNASPSDQPGAQINSNDSARTASRADEPRKHFTKTD